MITHPPHVEHAKRALRYFDDATTGAEIGSRGVMAANALRVLLYEPEDGYQGDDWETRCVTEAEKVEAVRQ